MSNMLDELPWSEVQDTVELEESQSTTGPCLWIVFSSPVSYQETLPSPFSKPVSSHGSLRTGTLTLLDNA